ncbi:hypothetical protein MKX01_024661 [Papaver californicum]|nr:hypothetical protein MKX01_024661 [Papaver californicum]
MRNIIKPFSTSSSSSYVQNHISSSLVQTIIGIGSLIVLVPLFFCVSTHQCIYHPNMAHLLKIQHHDQVHDYNEQSKASSPPLSSILRPFNGASSDHYYYPLNLIKKNQQTGDLYDEKLKKMESNLGSVRVFLKETAAVSIHRNSSTTHEDTNSSDDPDYYIPNGQIYRNPYLFHRSYQLMEKMFKIFVYEEGEPPLFHDGPCKNIYSTEGMFINTLEMDTNFRTRDPDEAHVFFLPFSVVKILEYLFHPKVRDKAVLGRTIGDYIRLISQKYPYWNRSSGADHFMLSCHDWGPRATWYVPQLYYNSIRVLCNANTSEYFNPKKDASFPEINIKTDNITGLVGGPPPSERTILAFFAGGIHGFLRRPLLKHWKEKDDDLRIYETLPKNISYEEMMHKSKYCICPSGYEVASPRIVEAIYAECVPVLISQHYILPFTDVLNWTSFSIEISVREIPNLKKILMDIPYDRYVRMQERVKQVQRHFVMNDPPKRYDVFHMIIHSVWLRRLNAQMI